MRRRRKEERGNCRAGVRGGGGRIGRKAFLERRKKRGNALHCDGEERFSRLEYYPPPGTGG